MRDTDAMPGPASGQRWTSGITIAALLLFAPLALLGMTGSPNEYAAIGIDGAVDCDGPGPVLVFALPALLVYAIGLAVFARRARHARPAANLVGALCCAAICIGLAVNVASALKEQSRDAHRASCGAA